MRKHAHDSSALSPSPTPVKGDWTTVKTLLPYLWEHRGRVVLALTFLVMAKLANVAVPLVMKSIVDSLDKPGALMALPLLLLLGYGVLRLATTLFGELRDVVFAKVTQHAIRRIALQVFGHLHGLSLRFHLERQTGGVSRDIERGTRAIETLMRFTLFSIVPTLIEIALVAGILLVKYDIWFKFPYYTCNVIMVPYIAMLKLKCAKLAHPC